MRKVIPTNYSIKGWIVYPYEYGLFVCSGKFLPLPANYAEVGQDGGVICGGLVAMYG